MRRGGRLSPEMKERIFRAFDGGATAAAVAQRFGIGESTAKRLHARWSGAATDEVSLRKLEPADAHDEAM